MKRSCDARKISLGLDCKENQNQRQFKGKFNATKFPRRPFSLIIFPVGRTKTLREMWGNDGELQELFMWHKQGFRKKINQLVCKLCLIISFVMIMIYVVLTLCQTNALYIFLLYLTIIPWAMGRYFCYPHFKPNFSKVKNLMPIP